MAESPASLFGTWSSLVIQNSGKISQMTIRLIHVRKKGHKVHRKLGGRFTRLSSGELICRYISIWHMEPFFDFTFGCQGDFWRLQPEGKRFSHEIAMFRCYGHLSCCLLRFPSSFQLQKKIFLGGITQVLIDTLDLPRIPVFCEKWGIIGICYQNVY